MKIYTRTGDGGQTGLFGGGRVEKDDARVAAYGDVDELNAALGVARAAGLGTLDAWCQDLQDQLFSV
jgi:cob(I)alamin adenosyltransferase